MVVVYGTVCVDFVRRIERLPGPSQYAEVLGERRCLGGEAANTAVALRTWGVEVQLWGNPVGDDELGHFIRHELASFGIEPNLPSSALATPSCDIYVTPDGRRTMFGRGFKDLERDSEQRIPEVPSGAWATADPNLGSSARRFLSSAAASGARSYAMDFIRDDEPYDSFTIWQTSTDWLGVAGDRSANEDVLRSSLAGRKFYSILTDGVEGLWAGGSGEGPRWYPAFPALSVVDSTGAGDVFRAGMLLGLDSGRDPKECLSFASAAAALSCRSEGGVAGIPTLTEVEAWIRAHPEVAAQYAP